MSGILLNIFMLVDAERGQIWPRMLSISSQSTSHCGRLHGMYSGIWSCVHKLSDSHGCHMMHATSAASHIGESGCVSAAARLRPCTIGPGRRPAWIYHRTIPRISLSRNCKLSAPNQVGSDQILVCDVYLRKNGKQVTTHLCCCWTSVLLLSLLFCIIFVFLEVGCDRPKKIK